MVAAVACSGSGGCIFTCIRGSGAIGSGPSACRINALVVTEVQDHMCK